MCDPISLAGVALTAGGTALRTVASNDDNAARTRALSAEGVRQQQLQQQAYNTVNQAASTYQNFGGQEAQRAHDLGQFFGQTTSAPTPMSGFSESTAQSPLVAQEEQRQRQNATDFGNHQATALGNLRAFGDVMGGLNRGAARATQQVGQINSNMRGSASVLPYELDSASHAGDTALTFGNLLGGAGRLAIGAGGGFGSLGSMFGPGAMPTMAQGGYGPDMPASFRV